MWIVCNKSICVNGESYIARRCPWVRRGGGGRWSQVRPGPGAARQSPCWARIQAAGTSGLYPPEDLSLPRCCVLRSTCSTLTHSLSALHSAVHQRVDKQGDTLYTRTRLSQPSTLLSTLDRWKLTLILNLEWLKECLGKNIYQTKQDELNQAGRKMRRFWVKARVMKPN